MATVEAVNQSTEQNKFLRYENIRKVGSPIFDHTNGAATGHAIRLNGTANERYGLAKSLSVMPGDVIKMEVFAKYLDGNTANWTAALTNLISQIAAGMAPAGTVIDGGGYAVSTATFPFPDMLGKAVEAGPKAYLNWLVFDRDYKLIPTKSGYKRMTTLAAESGQDVAHEKLEGEIVIAEAGYVYIYLSNEEATPVEVFFDDFKVAHTKSPVVQSDEYYPFGLTFNSYRRENNLLNQYQYNDKELQDELNLGWLDYGARMHIPELGRWGVIDPLAEVNRRWSPYNYTCNNPVRFVDPDGMLTYDWNTGNYVDDDGNIVDKDAAMKQVKGMGETIYSSGNQDPQETVDPREGNDVASIDFKNARVVKTYGEQTTGFIQSTMDETLYKKARELRAETSFIGTVRNPAKWLEAVGVVDDIMKWDTDVEAVSAAWMQAARSTGGYDYVEYNKDGGMTFRQVRDISSAYGEGYNNMVTAKIVFNAQGEVVYAVDYKGSSLSLITNGVKQRIVVPYISIPSDKVINKQSKPLVVSPNIE